MIEINTPREVISAIGIEKVATLTDRRPKAISNWPMRGIPKVHKPVLDPELKKKRIVAGPDCWARDMGEAKRLPARRIRRSRPGTQ